MDKERLIRLLENPDFSDFTEEIINLWKCEQAAIQTLCKGVLDPSKMAELNKHVAKKEAYEQILLVRKGMLEEILSDEEMETLSAIKGVM